MTEIEKSTVEEVRARTPVLFIIEKYETAWNYLYPLLVNISRKHRILRDDLLHAINEQYRLLYIASKSNTLSKLYDADANLAFIKGLLGRLVSLRDKMSIRQYEIASTLLSEVGSLIGSWSKRLKNERKG